MENNNKIILKNTLLLYGRMLLSMFVALFTSRVVLQTLGVEDFGIYGVVGGVVSLFSFINSSMTSATSRFITFEMGKNNAQNLNKIFNIAFFIHVGIALIILVLSETIGLWFLENKLVIPIERMGAARWVYQLSILTMAISVTQVPYTACIISHERIDIYAYVDLCNIFIRLGIVYLLVIVDADKLLLYSTCMTLVSVGVALFYRFFCHKHFIESHLSRTWDKNIFNKMLTFSGWDLLGNLSITAKEQGVGMLINMFYGVTANAASGVTGQIQGIVMAFASNILTAVKPQIIKCYANGNYERSSQLIEYSSIGIFYLLVLLTIPLVLEMHYILHLWLGIVPKYVITFCTFTLILNVFCALAMLNLTISHAAEKNKYPSLINGIMYLSTLPVTYCVFKLSDNIVWFPYLYNMLSMILGCLIITYLASRYLPTFSFKRYFFSFLLKNILIVLLVVLLVQMVQSQLGDESFLRLLIVCILSTCLLLSLGYLFGIDSSLRKMINNYISQKIRK